MKFLVVREIGLGTRNNRFNFRGDLHSVISSSPICSTLLLMIIVMSLISILCTVPV